MSDNPNAEIIAIGTEILLGEITDTNSVYIVRVLRDLGINVYYMTTVGDNEQRIAATIQQALKRSQVVITCGGLGPTVDDMTRQGIARATGRELVFHQELFDQIAARFASFRVRMTENNRRQAYLPDGGQVIENPVGTAPAFMVETADQRVVISLPGVPREMKFLIEKEVIPYLRQRYQLGLIKARVLQTAGIGESMLDDLIGEDLLNGSNPTVGLAAHHGCVDVRITAKANNEADADRMLDEMESQLRERIGDHIFGKDGDRIDRVLAEKLRDIDGTLAIVEAGIGHVISDRLSQIDGRERWLTMIDYYDHPEQLRSSAKVDTGLSLRELSIQVARKTLSESGVTVCIVIASLPDVGENADVEEATVVVVHTVADTRSRVYGFGAQSELAREWVSNWSLAAAWRMLKEQNKHNVV